jgi:DNA-directed RNA polymerase subunit RPC12/RpoP
MPQPTNGIKIGLKVRKYFARIREVYSEKRIADLESRVAALERRLERAPGEACPHCGALSFRVQNSEPDAHSRNSLIREMRCEECGFKERWTVRPIDIQQTRRS